MSYQLYDPNNPQAFQDLVKSWDGDKAKAREYAEQTNYSPNQMAKFYNAGNPNSTLTGNEAAGMLGVDPSQSGTGMQMQGGYQSTRDPQTGAPSQPVYSQNNVSGWAPGSGMIDNAPSFSQMPAADFYKNTNHLFSTYGDAAPDYMQDYMQKYGYSVADVVNKYNQGSGGHSNSSYSDAAELLGIGGSYTDPLIPNNPALTNTPGQVTMPSMSMPGAPGWINDLSQGIPEWFDAFEGLKQLPGDIDKWTDESLKHQRVTGDQVSSLLDILGEQRAGSGIMGGTVDSAAKAEYLSNLTKTINDNKMNLTNNANQMKASVRSAMPGQAMSPINTMASLYGMNASDQQGWANLAANMLNTGY